MQAKLLQVATIFPRHGVRSHALDERSAVVAERWTGRAAAYPICMVGGSPPNCMESELDVVLTERCDVGVPITLAGDDVVQLGHGDFALVPGVVPQPCDVDGGQVVANGAATVRAAEGP